MTDELDSDTTAAASPTPSGPPTAAEALPSATDALRAVQAALRNAEAALVGADAAVPGSGSGSTASTGAVRSGPGGWSPALVIAATASLGAGAVHAAAIGAHAEHQQVVKAFTVLAVLQLGWGALALVRPSRWLASVGVVLGGAAVVGWIMAKTSGVSFIDGMETAEAVQWSDGLCAALAAVAAIGAGVHYLVGQSLVGQSLSGQSSGAPAVKRSAPALRRASIAGTAVIAALSLTGMNAAATHAHAGAGHSAHGADEAADGHHAADGTAEGAAADDGHGHATDGDAAAADGDESSAASSDDHAGHGKAAAVAPVPYDPTLPIDLGGVEGVTPQQQARAENLIAITLARLPQFADVSTLEAKGYHSINDAGTGHEHYINWDLINDGRQLDPDYPESLVFEMVDGKKTLVSAMFMAEGGVDLDHVPDVGGALTQWHIHDNLCYTESDPPRVAGLTNAQGECRPGTRTLGNPVPMIHVWIRAHKCGPFAALDGVGAGQVKPGETTLCDAAHGHESS